MGWKEAGVWAWRALRWILKAAVVAAVLLGLLLIAAGAPEYVDMSKLSATGANAWLMTLGLLGIGALLYAVARFLARVFLSPRSWELFGSNAAARLIALGAVALAYPRAILSLVTAPLTVLLQLAGELPAIVKRLADQEPPAFVALDLTLARAAWLAETVGVELSRAVQRLFDLMPIPDVVVALALWAILGHLLSSVSGSVAGEARHLRILALVRSLTEQQRRIAALTVVFLFGIYLSTAAIVAIPWMEESGGQQSFTRERLEKALEPLGPKPGESEPALVPAADLAGHFKAIERTFDDARKRVDAERAGKAVLPSVTPDFIGELSRIVADAKTDRDRATRYRSTLQEEFNQRRSQLVSDALATFEAETAVPMNGQERAFFFHDVQRFTKDQVDIMQRTLRECGRRVADLDKQFEFAAGELAGILARAEGASPVAFNQAHTRLRGLESGATAAIRACNQQVGGPLYVSARDPGANWGPFALVSQWLLRTRSHELALVSGMFGFGLLGSAVVTFVRRRPGQSAAQLMLGSVAGEVASIIARGLSAAIVVFLAVKGGLAIFSGGETNPNAYVLFFTCLVGAVFSEDVWDWARKKFAGQLPANGQARAGNTKAAKAKGGKAP